MKSMCSKRKREKKNQRNNTHTDIKRKSVQRQQKL